MRVMRRDGPDLLRVTDAQLCALLAPVEGGTSRDMARHVGVAYETVRAHPKTHLRRDADAP